MNCAFCSSHIHSGLQGVHYNSGQSLIKHHCHQLFTSSYVKHLGKKRHILRKKGAQMIVQNSFLSLFGSWPGSVVCETWHYWVFDHLYEYMDQQFQGQANLFVSCVTNISKIPWIRCNYIAFLCTKSTQLHITVQSFDGVVCPFHKIYKESNGTVPF